MKVLLIIMFVSNGPHNVGSVHTLEYEMPSLEVCKSQANSVKEILADELGYSTFVTTKCLEVPK